MQILVHQQQNPQKSAAAALLSNSGAAPATDAAPKPQVDYIVDAQRKFLEIPDRQRLKFIDQKYLQETIAWPPIMIEGVTSIARNVGDYKLVSPE